MRFSLYHLVGAIVIICAVVLVIVFGTDFGTNKDGSIEIELPGLPGITYRWVPGSVTEIEHFDYWGRSAYLADLNGDGWPEFCNVVSVGSGFVHEEVDVYDYVADKNYELSDRFYYNYNLLLESGRLVVIQTDITWGGWNGGGSGELAIINGELTAIGIDRRHPLATVREYYFEPAFEDLHFQTPLTELDYTYADVDKSKLKEETVAFSTIMWTYDKGTTISGPDTTHIIVLTRESDGDWEVIYEGLK
ncbi:MAG: hypothetical protein FWF85_03620 [Clostridiales bacterium]|nr:hypothetical protein [Clostridiales bacterium]